MGLFSSKYKTYASTVTTKLMDKFENPIPGIIIGSVISDASIANALNDYQMHGTYNKALAYYRYGKSSYARGLPSGYIRNTSINTAVLADLIETDIEATIEILYAFYDQDFYEQFIRVYLQNERGRDYTSGLIGTNPSGITGDIYFNSYNQIDLVNELRIIYKDSTDTIVGNEIIPFNYTNNIAYQVLYRLLGEDLLPIPDVDPFYWISIEEDTGSDPEDEVGENIPIIPEKPLKEVKDSYYFPIIPFFEDKIEIGSASDKASHNPLYETSRACLKKFGIKFDDLSASIRDGTADSIGSDKGIYIYFQLGAEVTAGATFVAAEDVPDENDPPPVFSSGEIAEIITRTKTNQATLCYLYEMFIELNGNDKYTKSHFENAYKFGLYKKNPKKNSILITDDSYQLTLSYFYISFKIVSGSITGIPDWCTSEVYERSTVINSLKLGDQGINSSSLILRKQITPDTYGEIEVCGLTQEFNIFKNKSSITYLDDAFKSEDPVFMTIPLNYGLVKKVPNKHRNALIHASMCLVVNSYTIQEVKWYQTGLFKAVLQIISIIFSPFTAGASLTILFIIRVIAYFIITAIIGKYIIEPIFKWIAKELGAEAAAVLGVVLMVVGAYRNMPYAGYIFEAGKALFQGIDLAYQDYMRNLQKDFTQFHSEVDKLNDQLDDAQGLLDREMVIDPITMFTGRPTVVWGESPDEYVTGKVQLTALTLATIQMPSIYVEMMVRLPTTNETLKM